MKFTRLLASAVALGCLSVASIASAADVMVKEPWARASAGAVKNGAAFMVLMNHGEADKLISAKADVSKRVELHTHVHDNGVMRMREVPAIEVPAHGAQYLKPGSYHVMFMGLNAPLKAGESFPLTLTFEKAGDVTVQVPVKQASHMGGHKKMKHGAHGGHDGHNMGKN